MHSKISYFYNDLNNDSLYRNLAKIRQILIDENIDKREEIYESFKVFTFMPNREKLDLLIIEEYKKKYFFKFLNKQINILHLNDGITYFTSRFINALNSYAKTKQKYFNGDEMYLGTSLPYSSLLKYEREKGKIIFFSDFKIATKCKNTAELWAKRFVPQINYRSDCGFSVIFTIQNNYKNVISNAIEIENANMKEIIILPFSFYHLKDIKIDDEKYTCDICLQNIGKNEILEEKIKMGKSIKYNNEKDIMEDV